VMLTELPLPTISAWTDGSASGGTRRGGAGAIVEFDGGRQKLYGLAGEHTSSLQAECVALRICINHIGVNYLPNLPVGPAEIRICTDSLSALCALKAGPSAQRYLICGQNMGRTSGMRSTWSPFHAGVGPGTRGSAGQRGRGRRGKTGRADGARRDSAGSPVGSGCHQGRGSAGGAGAVHGDTPADAPLQKRV
jgi:hypothetical protein